MIYERLPKPFEKSLEVSQKVLLMPRSHCKTLVIMKASTMQVLWCEGPLSIVASNRS